MKMNNKNPGEEHVKVVLQKNLQEKRKLRKKLIKSRFTGKNLI